MANYFDILGLSPQADKKQIKLRYKQLSSRCHPDRGGSSAMMSLVNLSYAKICEGKGHERAYSNRERIRPSHDQTLKLQHLLSKLSQEHKLQSKQHAWFRRTASFITLVLISSLLFSGYLLTQQRTQFAAQSQTQQNALAQLQKELEQQQQHFESASSQQALRLGEQNQALDQLNDKFWLHSQRLRLSQGNLSYAEDDLVQALAIIETLINTTNIKALSEAQQRYIASYIDTINSIENIHPIESTAFPQTTTAPEQTSPALSAPLPKPATTQSEPQLKLAPLKPKLEPR